MTLVLVVEDNPQNRKLATLVMRSEGYEVDAAVDAEEAQVRIAARQPDLVLMDLGLPGMDGLTLTRQLRNEAATRDLRIIALTAFAMRGDEDKALEAGCDAYVTKPFEMAHLAQCVADVLAKDPGALRKARRVS